MYKVIVFTHGTLGTSLVGSAAMLIGSIEDVDCFSILPGCDLGQAEQQLRQCLSRYKAQNIPVLAFSDLFFGTPFNILMGLSREFDFWHITGVNLPTLIEALTPRNQDSSLLPDLIPSIMTSGSRSIVCCNDIVKEQQV